MGLVLKGFKWGGWPTERTGCSEGLWEIGAQSAFFGFDVMARQSNSEASTAIIGFDSKLEIAADKLRNNMDAVKYKGDNVSWVPADAHWVYFQASAKRPTIGKIVDETMVAIERDKPCLKGFLPKDCVHLGFDKRRFGEIVDFIATSDGKNTYRSVDLRGRAYECFLTGFARAEGNNGAEFYALSCVMRCLAEPEPVRNDFASYNDRIYDSVSDYGGMVVQLEKWGKYNERNFSKCYSEPHEATGRLRGEHLIFRKSTAVENQP